MQTQRKTTADKLAGHPDSAKPRARLEFAQRLREYRVPRGYRTARSLARALGIDENRYTRYERAEVEPDLALIRRMCAVLGISPTELLGSPGANGADDASSDSHAAAAEERASAAHPAVEVPIAREAVKPPDGSARAVSVEFAAWHLACVVAEARIRQSATGPRATEPSSVALLSAASPLYSRLRQAPFEMIEELTADRAIIDAPPAVSAKVLSALNALVAALGAHQDVRRIA